MLAPGTKAPEFTLSDKDGNQVSLSDFAGRKTVVYFYPKDSTPGCTRQACAFADAYDKFRELGVAVNRNQQRQRKISQQLCGQVSASLSSFIRSGAYGKFRLMMSGKKKSCMERYLWELCAVPILLMKTESLKRQWKR